MREMTELKIAGKPDLTAILLAGGKSRRMGCDKAMLPFEGGTLLEWQIRKLRLNDPTQFEQVDETCEFGGAVLYSESLGITAFF